MSAALHDRAAAFLRGLSGQSAIAQHDAFINECLENFALLEPPHPDRSHLWQITLHGISATGTSEEEVFANWKRLAKNEASRSRHNAVETGPAQQPETTAAGASR